MFPRIGTVVIAPKQLVFMTFHELALVFFLKAGYQILMMQSYLISMSRYCLFIQPSAVVVLHHCDVFLLRGYRFDTSDLF